MQNFRDQMVNTIACSETNTHLLPRIRSSFISGVKFAMSSGVMRFDPPPLATWFSETHKIVYHRSAKPIRASSPCSPFQPSLRIRAILTTHGKQGTMARVPGRNSHAQHDGQHAYAIQRPCLSSKAYGKGYHYYGTMNEDGTPPNSGCSLSKYSRGTFGSNATNGASSFDKVEEHTHFGTYLAQERAALLTRLHRLHVCQRLSLDPSIKNKQGSSEVGITTRKKSRKKKTRTIKRTKLTRNTCTTRIDGAFRSIANRSG
jgi:hypothetical protein